MLSCLRATELVEKKLQVRLNFKEKVQLKLHVKVCKACSDYEKQSILIDKALRSNRDEINQQDVKRLKVEIIEKLSLNR